MAKSDSPLNPYMIYNGGRYFSFSKLENVFYLINPLCFPAAEMRKSL